MVYRTFKNCHQQFKLTHHSDQTTYEWRVNLTRIMFSPISTYELKCLRMDQVKFVEDSL